MSYIIHMGANIDMQMQVPTIWDVADGEVRVTLFPTGHLAVGVEEFLKGYGYSEVPEDLGREVRTFLASTYGPKKVLSEDDGKRISDEIACLVRAWLNKQPEKSV